MSCCSLEKKIFSDVHLSTRPTLQHRKEMALGKTNQRYVLGQRLLRLAKLRVTWSDAQLSEMQQNRLEKTLAWKPGDLPVSNLFYNYRGIPSWDVFPHLCHV